MTPRTGRKYGAAMRFVAPSLLFCIMFGVATGHTRSASAEDIYSTLGEGDGSTVKDDVRRAKRARDAGRWTEAHAAYKAAFEAADPASSTERERAELAGELGMCELELRKYRDAAEHLAWSLEQRDALPLQLQLRFEAGQRKAAPHVGTLYLSVEPPDAEVLIDGKAISAPARTYRLFLEPGEHMVRARSGGYEEAFQSFDAQAGKATTISMRVPRAATPAAVSKDTATGTREAKRSARGVQAATVAPSSSSTASTLRVAGAVLAGATMVAGGGVLMWSAYTEDELHDRATALRGADREADRCARQNAPHACSELRDLQEKRDLLRQVGWVGLATGGAIGALTLASLLVSRTSTPSDGVRVVPTAGGRSAGLMMVGAW
ncbi:PEGA domain-containing protein [Sorangium sp. So ce1182]|uniref:PEGA domain-containing protein n=1 Tax=Sorangium sp. So ce1182 TaxID=3133334 RepID=UPI003F60E8A2